MAALPVLIPRYSIQDLECWDDRWELIDGYPHAMSPSPAYPHQRVAHGLAVLFDKALEGCAACWVVSAGNWRISEDTVVIPDLLVACDVPPPEGVYLDEAPTLIVEILSPSTAAKDRTVKHELYAREGVQHYVLVDVGRRSLEAFKLEGGEYGRSFWGSEGEVAFDLGPCTVSLDVGRVWTR